MYEKDYPTEKPDCLVRTYISDGDPCGCPRSLTNVWEQTHTNMLENPNHSCWVNTYRIGSYGGLNTQATTRTLQPTFLMSSTPIHTAVILAAGLGSRLGEYSQEKPKGFLEIAEKSLIERSIQCLLQHGINQIVIGTGYLAECYEQLSQQYPQLTTCQNPDYATTGSLYTLYTLRNLLSEPFLLLESDLLYEPAALKYILAAPEADVILASGPTHSGDEVFIQHSPDGLLQNMSKDLTQLTAVHGELTGINKLSVKALHQMIIFAEAQYKSGNYSIHYEDALVGIATLHPICVQVVQDLVWCEIDNEMHLKRALEVVYPAMGL